MTGPHGFKDVGNNSDGGEDNDYRYENCKSRLNRNTPKFVIIYFGILSFFELNELVFRIKISVIIRTGKDCDRLGYRVIFNRGHCLLAMGANR